MGRILAEEFLYAREWTSEQHRSQALEVWNVHYNYRLIVEASTGTRKYRSEGDDGLRPKRAGRPPKYVDSEPGECSELEQLRSEKERFRAEVAYLGNCGP